MSPREWKYNKIFRILALGIIFVLLVVPFSVIQAYAVGGGITLYPNKGEIGDSVEVDGGGFDANQAMRIYFSSNNASKGDDIDNEVTAYERVGIGITFTNALGNFDSPYDFVVPDELADGANREDVHGGDYYVYAASAMSNQIKAVAQFTVIDGEIKLDPEEGQVGTEVKIRGEGLRPNRKVGIKYDGNFIDIASSDNETDSDGRFSCTIIIPEGTAGSHIITAIDESGNKPEAKFRVKPELTINPTSATIGKTIEFRGTGFGREEVITITLYGYKTPTTPVFICSNQRGSFNGSFGISFELSYVDGGITQVGASDNSFNTTEAQLTILPIPPTPPIPASISLSPTTSLTSPGHVGMELFIAGTRFIANTMVTVTYSNSEIITVATTTTDANGSFSAAFTAPPSVAGSHAVTATDETNTVTSVFTMESETPLMPVLLLPEVAAEADTQEYFNWTDVTDPSSVTYILQVGTDCDFATIALEKRGLTDSEYTLNEEEKLEPTEKKTPYYWRVKAIDGAFNESEWTPPGLFYVGFFWTPMPDWVQYTFYGLGGLLLGILGFWVLKGFTRH